LIVINAAAPSELLPFPEAFFVITVIDYSLPRQRMSWVNPVALANLFDVSYYLRLERNTKHLTNCLCRLLSGTLAREALIVRKLYN
jgi:hypothetical protein